MSDLLIESEDALKQERLMAFWKDNGSFIIGMVLLTIFLTGALSFYRTWDKNARETQTAAIIEMVDAPTFPDNVRDAVLTGELNLRKTLKALPVLQAIGKYRAEGNTDAALSLLKPLSADKKITDEHRDLSYILWAQTSADAPAAAPPEDIKTIMAGLKTVADNTKSPWYTLANFEYGVALNAQGDHDGAQAALSRVQKAKIVPETLRARARSLANLYKIEHAGQ